jgi:hypothetical protein
MQKIDGRHSVQECFGGDTIGDVATGQVESDRAAV